MSVPPPSTCPPGDRFVVLLPRETVDFLAATYTLAIAFPFPRGHHLVSQVWVECNEVERQSEEWAVYVEWWGWLRGPQALEP